MRSLVYIKYIYHLPNNRDKHDTNRDTQENIRVYVAEIVIQHEEHHYNDKKPQEAYAPRHPPYAIFVKTRFRVAQFIF